ncbi:HpcH/HpaI aldolase family protein [Buttiauxella warmboldiae]|nr:aldolase/citrate lyase family protein [Buttiauxella warmboldiae]
MSAYKKTATLTMNRHDNAVNKLSPNYLKQKIIEGQRVVGTWLQSGNSTFAEMIGFSALDFFIIDQEHGPGDLQTVIDMARAAAFSKTTAVVRCPGIDIIYIKRLIEAGIEAILVPMVETADQAAAIVEACRFPPLGKRGDAAHVTRSSYYGFVQDYHQHASDKLMIMIQIETKEGVNNAAEILSVAGIDLVFVGPSDLAGSINELGNTGSEGVTRLINQVINIAKKYDIPLGTVPRDTKTAEELFEDGFSLISVGSDVACYFDFLQNIIKQE